MVFEENFYDRLFLFLAVAVFIAGLCLSCNVSQKFEEHAFQGSLPNFQDGRWNSVQPFISIDTSNPLASRLLEKEKIVLQQMEEGNGPYSPNIIWVCFI